MRSKISIFTVGILLICVLTNYLTIGIPKVVGQTSGYQYAASTDMLPNSSTFQGKNLSSKWMPSSDPSNHNSIGTTANATTSGAVISRSTISLVAQYNSSNTGIHFQGQTNVRTLRAPAPGTSKVPFQIPFHPTNLTSFMNAKRQADLNKIKPQVKVFSTHRNNRSSSSSSSTNNSSNNSSNSPSSPTLVSPSTSSSTGFDGLTQSQAGFNGRIFYPPDVQAASGPTYITEMANLGGEVLTKQGSSVSTFALPTFFKISSTSDEVTDPKIMYDAMSGRWFASLSDITTAHVQIAVSATNDPRGVWNIYSLGFSNCPDQPIIGLSSDKFAVSVNEFASTCSGAFTGVQYYIIDKGDLVNGVASPRSIESAPDTSTSSLHPVQALSSTSTLFMVDDNTYFTSPPSSILRLYSFTGSVPSITKSVVSLTIQKTNVAPGALQPGTTITLDTGDDRIQDAEWYQGKLWVTLNDACTPPGDTTVRSCIRLDQIDTTANKVLQDFDKGDSGQYYFYPALSIEGGGNLDFIYGLSSATAYPSLSASGQDAGTPANTLDPPVSLKVGSAADTSGRYGDYFGAGVDPSNTNNVWVAGEYHSTSTWSTFISSVNTPAHATTLTLNTVNSVPWSNTVTVTGKLTDNVASGQGISGKTIIFTSPNSSPLPPSATTKTDGTFSSSFKSSSTIFSGWQLQAKFAGDSTYMASASTIRSYNTVKHTTSLTLAVPLNVPWGTTATISGKLSDSSAGGVGVASKNITFTTSNGSPLPASVTTASDGTYKATFTASKTTFSGWNIQAHFAGDSLYNAAASTAATYNTVKHTTSLSLAISPTSVKPGGSYSVSGTLTDTTKSVGLASKTITFTATSPITISSKTTNTLGQYSATGLIAPTTTGTYSIQAHYAGESLYNAANSPTRTLTVSTTAAAATPTSTAKMASTATTPSSGAPTATPPAANTSSTTSPSPSSPSPPLTLHSSTNTNTNGNHTAQSASAKKQPLTSSQSKSPPPSLFLKQQHQQQYPYSAFRNPYPSPSYPYFTQQQQQQQPSPQPLQRELPIANPGQSQTVYENIRVVLDGTKSYDPNPGGIIVAYQWTQLPTRGGVPVNLIGSNTATPYFIAPKLPNDNTILAFSLRVMDNHGAISTNPAVVYVMVKHNNNPGIGSNVPGTTLVQPPQLQGQQRLQTQPQKQP